MSRSAAAEGPEERPPRVTIADVSAALGLAKGTVSRALNGYPDISESTRARVRAAAERMGYRPLSQAQAIRTGRSRALGLVIETGEPDAHRPFLADFIAGISEAASAEGWTLTMAAADTEARVLETMGRLAEERKADGFILPRTRARDARIERLRSLGIPFVLFGRTLDATGCAWFDIEGEAAMAEAVTRLAALGHRRIAFVGSGAAYNYERLRREGYLAGLAAAGLPADPALVAEGADDAEGGAAAAGRLLDLADPPTGFVYAVDRAALGLWRAAASRGLTVGRDLSVTGYDGIPEAGRAGLSTFHVDIRAAGARLARMLIARVRGTAPEALRETARAPFVARASTGPAPARPADGPAEAAASIHSPTGGPT